MTLAPRALPPAPPAGVDLADPEWFARADPHATFDRLRAGRAAYRASFSGRPYWIFTRHADVAAIVRDAATFTSEYGVNLRELRRDGKDPAAGKLLEMCGPPAHRSLRPVLNALHSRRAVAAARHRLLAVVGGLVDRAVRSGAVDAARDLAAPAAATTAFTLLGVPEDDWPILAEGNHRSESMDPRTPVRPPFTTAAEQANHDLLRYFLRLAGKRRHELAPGTLRGLLDTGAGGSLSREEVVLNALGLMDAAYGTLRHATSGGLLALVQHPEQCERVRRDPALLPGLCEEVVRWVSPVMHLARVATRDVVVAGADVRAGDAVTAWVVSANRDESVFDEPHRFLAGRTPNRHLGFAVGPHACLAAGLARTHLEIVLGAFLRRVSRAELGGPVERVVSNVVSGIDSLPLTVGAR